MKPLSFPAIPKNIVMMIAVAVGIFTVIGIGNHFFENRPAAPRLQIGTGITLLGRAGVAPLANAAAGDPLLKTMLDNIAKVPTVDYFARPNDVNELVVNIIFRWTGADMAVAQSYGPYIDARVVAVLQAMASAPETVKAPRELTIEEVAPLNEMWFRIYDHYRIRLLTQMGGREIYAGGVAYDLNADKLNITGAISPDFIAGLQGVLQSSPNSADVIRAFLDYIDRTKGFDALSEQEQDLIMGLKPAEPAPVPEAQLEPAPVP